VKRPDGTTTRLRPKEADVLHPLISQPGRIIPYGKFLESMGYTDKTRPATSQTVNVHIVFIREAIGDYRLPGKKRQWRWINNILNKGFVFSEE